MSDTMTRRKTISDSLIDANTFYKLLNFTLTKVKDINDLKQTEIVSILLPKKLSNVTIAKVINTLIPVARATKGSVASLVRYIKGKSTLLDELLQDLGDDI